MEAVSNSKAITRSRDNQYAEQRNHLCAAEQDAASWLVDGGHDGQGLIEWHTAMMIQ